MAAGSVSEPFGGRRPGRAGGRRSLIADIAAGRSPSAHSKAGTSQETEGEGFEPSMEEKTPITVFETAAFNRSATPPGDTPG